MLFEACEFERHEHVGVGHVGVAKEGVYDERDLVQDERLVVLLPVQAAREAPAWWCAPWDSSRLPLALAYAFKWLVHSSRHCR